MTCTRSCLRQVDGVEISRCYFDKKTQLVALELHGFSDASENAYAAVVYLRMTDIFGRKQVSLISSKTKVAPIKRLTIPRLELCGAYLTLASYVAFITKTDFRPWLLKTCIALIAGFPKPGHIYCAAFPICDRPQENQPYCDKH